MHIVICLLHSRSDPLTISVTSHYTDVPRFQFTLWTSINQLTKRQYFVKMCPLRRNFCKRFMIVVSLFKWHARICKCRYVLNCDRGLRTVLWNSVFRVRRIMVAYFSAMLCVYKWQCECVWYVGTLFFISC